MKISLANYRANRARALRLVKECRAANDWDGVMYWRERLAFLYRRANAATFI